MLKNICEISSPSGREENIKEFLINELKSYTDNFFIDSFGNLYFVKKGNGESILIECGIDEPFLLVTESKDNILRFTAPPHIKASEFLEKNIVFKDLTSAFIESQKEEEQKVSDLYAEYKWKKEDFKSGTLMPSVKYNEEEITAFNIKYKAPTFVLVNLIKSIKENKNELIFMFSVQKCLANRGVRAMMQSGVEFSKAISLSCIEEKSESIFVMAKEKSCILPIEVRKELLSLAKERNIDVNIGFSDENFNTKTYLQEGYGLTAGLLCIPVNDNSIKFKALRDAENLLKAVCEKG